MTGLVIGRNGQVAVALRRIAPELTYLDRAAADLSDPTACAQAIKNLAPDFVINAAAYTGVDQAEADREVALEINANAPGAMARAASVLGIPFVHISSDYVFDGSGDKPWREDDATDPVNFYGASKREGEIQIAAVGGAFGILRTSWVFSEMGANFVKTMLRLGQSRDELRVVNDQIGGPTPAAGIAEACLKMVHGLLADSKRAGIYHYSGAPDVTWAEFAREIFAKSGMNVDVQPISSAEFPTAAARPKNSRLDCQRIHEVFGISRPDWRDALDEIISELGRDDAA